MISFRLLTKNRHIKNVYRLPCPACSDCFAHSSVLRSAIVFLSSSILIPEALLLLMSAKNWEGPNFWECTENSFCSQPVRLDSEHAQSDGKSVNHGLLVMNPPRGMILGADQKECSLWWWEWSLPRTCSQTKVEFKIWELCSLMSLFWNCGF